MGAQTTDCCLWSHFVLNIVYFYLRIMLKLEIMAIYMTKNDYNLPTDKYL